MKKLFLLTILLVVMYNSAISINPMKVAIYKTGAAANVQILINDYSGGSASLKYTGAIELLTPNASGIIVADIDGAGLSSIAAGDINPYYLIDVYVSGALARKVRYFFKEGLSAYFAASSTYDDIFSTFSA